MKRRDLLLAAAAAPLTLASTPRAGAAGAGGTETILVTADLESHVAAVDLTTGHVARRIGTLPGPRSIESAFASWAIVAHTTLGRVSILGAPRYRVERVVAGFSEPRYTAVHPSALVAYDVGPIAYVSDSGRREIVTIDVERGRILWRTPVPGPSRHLTVSPDGGQLWTALGTKARRLAILDLEDPRRPRLARTLATPFLAHDVVFASSPGERHVWVTSASERRLAVYEERGARPVAVLGASAPPQHVAFRGATAFVASGADGTVRTVASNGSVLNEARVPLGSYNVTLAWRVLVSPSLERGTLTSIDRYGDVRRVRRIARAAHDACYVVA